MVATLSEETEEKLTCQDSLTVDVYEGGRVTHDLTEQAADPNAKGSEA